MRNIEVLRDYFLGHDPQLKETLADNSLRLIGIPGNQFVIRKELINDLKQLKKEMEDYINEVIKDLDVEEIKELERKVNQLEEAVADLENWKEHNDLVSESELATALANYYTKTEIDLIIQNLSGLKYEVVEQLPTHNIKTDTIYLVPHEQGDEDEVKKLTGDIVLVDGTMPTLEEGLYYTGNYMIRRSGDSSLVGVFGHNEVVYYDATEHCFSGSLNYIVDFQGEWMLGNISATRASVKNSNSTVPLSSAVYSAVLNSDRAVMRAYMNSDYTMQDFDQVRLTLSNTSSTALADEKLILENGKIKIGSGVKKILASAQMFIDQAEPTGSYGHQSILMIEKNDFPNTESIIPLSELNVTATVPPTLISVHANDTISLKVQANTGDKIEGNNVNKTYLTVEVVEWDDSIG